MTRRPAEDKSGSLVERVRRWLSPEGEHYPEVVVDHDDTVVVNPANPIPTPAELVAIAGDLAAGDLVWPPVQRAVVAITGTGEPGTGFFVAPGRVLTARHIVARPEDLAKRRLTWGLLRGTDTTDLVADPSDFVTSAEYDFSIFGVLKPPSGALALPLVPRDPPGVGTPVIVYGYPSGRYLRRSGLDAGIIAGDAARADEIRYRADTMSGFSGGPVLDLRTGALLAMHVRGNQAEKFNVGLLTSTIAKELGNA